MATLGTALTDQHAKILSRYTPEIVLLYDADAAGWRRRYGGELFEESPAAVAVVILPPGSDLTTRSASSGRKGLRNFWTSASAW